MTRVQFSPEAAAKLEKVRKVNLGKDFLCYVRLLPGSVVGTLATLDELDDETRVSKLLGLMLSDEQGQRLVNGSADLAHWPAGYIARALQEGLDLNAMGGDDDPE